MDGKDKKMKIKAEPESDHERPSTVSVPQNTIITQNVIVQMMDIAEPLKTLRTLLAPRLHCSLKNHAIHLQGASGLDPDKSLLEQGVKAEGIVQFSVQVNSSHGDKKVINILDIVKPIIETVQIPVQHPAPQRQPESDPQADPQPAVTPSAIEDTTKKVMLKDNEQVTELIVCNNYREEQEKYNIPLDPNEWKPQHTEHWINWAASEFGVDPSDNMLKTFKVSGDKLCSLTREDFTRVLPNNTGDLMWTHLQVLIKTKDTPELTFTPSAGLGSSSVVVVHDQPTKRPKPPRKPSMNSTSEERILHGNRTGNNGQIQLWQFLLELLTDYKSLHCIQWVGNDGEFKLLDAELVAQKWGERKHKNSMNYEKLSRALRYYYDGDMIAKVHGKRFVYKFVCDLKELIGYDAAEMKKLVLEAQEKHDMEVISTAAALLT